MAGNHEAYCSLECSKVADLERDLEKLRKSIKGANIKECPNCGAGLVILTTMNLRVCDCGYQQEHKLKTGQKSLLVEGLIGE